MRRMERMMASERVRRFFGGSPGGVLLRLVVISFIVGIILSALGIAPDNILRTFIDLVRRIYDNGFEAVRWVYRYFLLGALIVFPIWLIYRLLKLGRRPGPG
jgi:Na+/H+-dicarboxylate symporter